MRVLISFLSRDSAWQLLSRLSVSDFIPTVLEKCPTVICLFYACEIPKALAWVCRVRLTEF